MTDLRARMLEMSNEIANKLTFSPKEKEIMLKLATVLNEKLSELNKKKHIEDEK